MKTAPLDVSSYLGSDEARAEYLTAVAEDENLDVLLAALGEVAKAHGMTQIAEASGIGRESLYKAVAPGGNPGLKTIRKVLRALNLDIRITVRGAAPVPAQRVAIKIREDAAQKIERRRNRRKALAAIPARIAKPTEADELSARIERARDDVRFWETVRDDFSPGSTYNEPKRRLIEHAKKMLAEQHPTWAMAEQQVIAAQMRLSSLTRGEAAAVKSRPLRGKTVDNT